MMLSPDRLSRVLRGPWDKDLRKPILIEYVTPSGIAAHLSRNVSMLHWCGYIELPLEYELAQAILDGDHEYEDLVARADEFIERLGGIHGGITYASKTMKPGFLTLGFDCAHATDLCPPQLHLPLFDKEDAKYWFEEDVRAELNDVTERIVKAYGQIKS